MTKLLDLFHKRCGGIAFRYDHIPREYEAIASACAVLLDGSVPIHNSDLRCGTCGERIEYLSALTVTKP